MFTSRIPIIFFLNIFRAIIVTSASHSDDWSYSNQDKWPESCNGKFQSPVNITVSQTKKLHFKNLYFGNNYYKTQKATITNNGYTIEVKIVNKTKPIFSGGGFKTNYVLEQFHFHWGSEHAVNGKRYALEGHFVHYAKKYKTLKTALNYKDGVAVLAVFYRILEKSNPAFDTLIDSIPKIVYKDTTVKLNKKIHVYNFFPFNIERYYRYKGSLTTPPCSEVVSWTVFAKPSFISRSQLEKLTNVKGFDNQRIKSNNREIQPLNGRTICLNTKK